MPSSDPLTHILDVPGAQLYYERRGTGPLLLLIGSPMDSTRFAGLAGRYTVVTCNPRGIGNSRREGTGRDVTPEQQAEDVHRRQRSMSTARQRPMSTALTASPSWLILTRRSTAVSAGQAG